MIKEININNILPNPWNPNKMPEGTLKKLKTSITNIGLLNPIIVREKGDKYEIIDGEHRTKVYKELGFMSIMASIIKASDDDVKKIIFASTIKGKHNALDSQEVLVDLLKNTSSKELLGLNLDKGKLERKTKYSDYKNGTPVVKGGRVLKDESLGLESTDDYTIILSIPLKKSEYEKVKDTLNIINKNWTEAILELCNRI